MQKDPIIGGAPCPEVVRLKFYGPHRIFLSWSVQLYLQNKGVYLQKKGVYLQKRVCICNKKNAMCVCGLSLG